MRKVLSEVERLNLPDEVEFVDYTAYRDSLGIYCVTSLILRLKKEIDVVKVNKELIKAVKKMDYIDGMSFPDGRMEELVSKLRELIR